MIPCLTWTILLISAVLYNGPLARASRVKRWKGGDPHGGDLSSMFRGVAGVDYPDMREIPVTNFKCAEQLYSGGLYADVETRCQVYHICHDGRKESFLCGKGTVFNQQILACDYWYSTDCDSAPNYYYLNAEISEGQTQSLGGGYQASVSRGRPSQPPRLQSVQYQPSGPRGPQQQTSGPRGPQQQTSGPRGPQQQTSGPRSPQYQPSGPQGPQYQPSSPQGPQHQPSGPQGPQHQPSGPQGPQHQPSGPRGPQHQPSGPRGPQHQPSGPRGPQHQPSGPQGPQYQPSGPQGPQYQPSGPQGPQYQPSGPQGPQYQPSGPQYQPSSPQTGGGQYRPAASGQQPAASGQYRPGQPQTGSIQHQTGRHQATVTTHRQTSVSQTVIGQHQRAGPGVVNQPVGGAVYPKPPSNKIKVGGVADGQHSLPDDSFYIPNACEECRRLTLASQSGGRGQPVGQSFSSPQYQPSGPQSPGVVQSGAIRHTTTIVQRGSQQASNGPWSFPSGAMPGMMMGGPGDR